MSGVVKISITESAETLKTLLAQQKTATGKERVQALYLLKTKQVETGSGSADRPGVERDRHLRSQKTIQTTGPHK